MVRMFGYVGAARVKDRLTPLTASLAAGVLLCLALAFLSRHWSGLASVRPYALEIQLAGFVLLLLEFRAIRRRDEQLLLTSGLEI